MGEGVGERGEGEGEGEGMGEGEGEGEGEGMGEGEGVGVGVGEDALSFPRLGDHRRDQVRVELGHVIDSLRLGLGSSSGVSLDDRSASW